MVEQHVAARDDGFDIAEALGLEGRAQVDHLQPVATDVDAAEQGDVARHGAAFPAMRSGRASERAFAQLDFEDFEVVARLDVVRIGQHDRSEEHTYELQSLMRISYAVFCLKKKKHTSSTDIQ